MQTAANSAAQEACAIEAPLLPAPPIGNDNIAYATAVIRVVDAIMGAGKTHWSYHHMNEEHRTSPNLAELDRQSGTYMRVQWDPGEEAKIVNEATTGARLVDPEPPMGNQPVALR